MPLIAAYLLSGKMEKSLIPTCRIDGRTIRFASLWKRSIARGIDVLLSSFPLVFAQYYMFKGFFSDDGTFFPFNFLENFVLMIQVFLVMLVLSVILMYLDGRGQTPGKMLMKIKTVRMDNLEPCGFLMSLVRNIAIIADSFFTYFVGIGLIAGTQYRQRAGDFAAKTIVIDLCAPMETMEMTETQ
jgi:uncharacterized RDD family membrane protein YckC